MDMYEREAIVTTKYGNMPSFMACPESGGPYPGIIIYFDAPGMREEMRNIARRVAKHGYFVLLPDLYYRLGTIRLDIPRRNDAIGAVIRACMNHLTNEFVYDDTAGMIAYLDAQDRVKPGPVGCVGYCMSGPFVMHAMARIPQRVAAGAAMYGIGMVTDKEDSPHLLAPKIKGELYIAFAEHDPGVPANVLPDLKAALDKAGTKYKMETIAGTHHGFTSPERKDYEPHAAEDTWAKIFAMWERNLKR
jgi:carboxymethylenebutenolidase